MAEGGRRRRRRRDSQSLRIIDLHRTLPRLVVFDHDYTLWPFYCECCYEDEMSRLYPQAKGIILALKDKGIEMGIASRSPTSDIAKRFLENRESDPSL